MQKNLLQDMVKTKRLSRRVQTSSLKDVNVDLQHNVGPSKLNNSKSRYKLWLVAIISIIFFIFSISFLFLEVTVIVNPKVSDVVLSEDLSASLDGNADVLTFDLVVISGEENKIVGTTEEKEVSKKAQGTVVIYNNFSSATQRLDIDTRLEGSNGKIYKTEKQVVVGGMQGTIPGSIEVGVYATEAGEEYNTGPLDFTIVGFKGTTKYSKFYGRSKGDIVGGFEGTTSIIPDAEKSAILDELKTDLQAKLFQKALDQIPAGFVLFKDAVFFKTEEDDTDVAATEDNMLPIKLKGTLYGFIFNEEKLTKKITEDYIKENDESSMLYISNIRDLKFSLPPGQNGFSNEDSISFQDVKEINFNVKGTAKIVWKLDESKLVADLLGKTKKDFSQILLEYPNIDSADLTIRPFWRRSLPDNGGDIKVIVNYPE